MGTGQAFVATEPGAARATTSGARIRPIHVDQADRFLRRIGVAAPDPLDFALGAHQDDATLIGVAALGITVKNRARAVVAVAPERRRLRVGTDLAHDLVTEAARLDIRNLWFRYPISAAADALVRSIGLIAARRVANGEVTATFLLTDRP